MIVIFLLVIHLLIVSIFVIDSCWAFEVVTVARPLFKLRQSRNIFDEEVNLKKTEMNAKRWSTLLVITMKREFNFVSISYKFS